MLADCGGSSDTLSPTARGSTNTFSAGRQTSGYRSLFSFDGKDGKVPWSGLTVLGGTLYGTTPKGGTRNKGTVFSITADGAEHVLYSFKGGADGKYPYGGLTALHGVLYGTTYSGGAYDAGTIYSITVAGKKSVLYSFKGGSGDGDFPDGPMTNLNGTLYGTTFEGGGGGGYGTIFGVTTSGAEHLVYSFKYHHDGAYPRSSLTAFKGSLYGTTTEGGANKAGHNECTNIGCGTVFSVTTAGKERVLHRFLGPPDGDNPDASGLTLVDGTFYGTTFQGGSDNEAGSVFSITPSGDEHVIYAFGESGNGMGPEGGLTDLNGTLYGATEYSGFFTCCGTIYSVTTAGSKQLLYTFTASSYLDGADPHAGVAILNGTLYGTTQHGGRNNLGTAFAFTP
ncbi:MAG TPA: choice-of-anchor tandem repeat GloVer-containing protein [Candidatus Cybelea sp.]|nr:choice-of-anchor tandem repeat GloVer-containing protein [Candidatus Cybelea sp.]